MDVTIAVSTFGDPAWQRLARERALPSAYAQGVADVIHVHGPTLHDARNAATDQCQTEWLINLDADDELEPGYVAALAAGTADVRAPAVRYVSGTNRGQDPRMPAVAGHNHGGCVAECLPYGNWLVVGAMVRADLIRKIGGWRDFPWSEDWDVWLRCHLAGATFEPVPHAIYRAYVRANSRNRGLRAAARLAAHRAIAAANGVPSP